MKEYEKNISQHQDYKIIFWGTMYSIIAKLFEIYIQNNVYTYYYMTQGGYKGKNDKTYYTLEQSMFCRYCEA